MPGPMRCARFLLLLCLASPASADEAAAPAPLVGGHKVLEVDRDTHDWGLAAQNESHTSTFTYTNRGETLVQGIKARGDCGCNRITLSTTSLAPGASGEMTVVFETMRLSGTLNKRIHLYTADKGAGRATIRQTIRIIKGLIVAPSSFHLGEVAADTLPMRKIALKWHTEHGQPFRVTAARVPGHDIGVAVTPHQDTDDERWKGWEVEVRFRTPPPLGMFSAEVVIETDHPKHARIVLPMSANVAGKVWVQSHTLHFGAFHANEHRKATIRFRPRDPNTSFGQVTARATLGKVADVTVALDPVHGDKGYWILSARVPADAPAGSLDGEVIVLDTGMAGVAPIEIKVKGHVRDAARGRK